MGTSAEQPITGAGEAPVIRVFLLDDHELVRRGLTDLLGSTTDLVVVGEASTCAEALHRIPAVAPQIALLDARLPDGSGIDVCRELRSAHLLAKLGMQRRTQAAVYGSSLRRPPTSA